jgi:hypothetical protein
VEGSGRALILFLHFAGVIKEDREESQNTRCMGRDLNQESREYEVVVITTRPWCSIDCL